MRQRYSLSQLATSYLAELGQALSRVDLRAVQALIDELMRVWRERRQVLLIGNGGSAALASHMANDLCKAAVVPGLPRIRAISLCDNVPLLSAWANDESYESVFSEPLQNLCRPGDLVLAVSCSGSSRNVLKALQVARELGARTALLTGDCGGCACQWADISVFAPAETIQQQEDIHLAVNHLISLVLRQWLGQIAERCRKPPRALVLAAGEGSRLRPLTLESPKPMLPVAGKPVLEHTLVWLRQHGVHDVAVNLHYRPEAIQAYFGDGHDLGLDLTYSHEERILGTAGAIRNLDGFLDGGPLIVVYGDVLTNLDLASLLSFHNQNVVRDPAAVATLSLYRVPNPTEVGLVGLDDDQRISCFVEKPQPEQVFTDLASAGVVVLEPAAVEHIPVGRFSDLGADLFPRLLSEGYSLYGWTLPAGAYLLDMGTPDRYARAQQEWPLVQRGVLA